jgi:hypothetical protein
MSAARGRCSVCKFSFRLRKDGSVQTHSLYYGSLRLPHCLGSGLKPLPPIAGEATEEKETAT